MNPTQSKDIREGETLDLGDGLTARVTLSPDENMGPPWKEEDGHGPVTERRNREEKRAGERILRGDRWGVLCYDWQGAMQQARRDGWGLADEEKARLAAKLGREPTPGEVRAQSVEQDFKHLYGWANDEWQYVVICVKLVGPDGEEIETDYLGGVESFGGYWKSQAAEMLDELRRKHEIETAERAHWEARDTATKG